jgi:uncharacterized protein (TIGR03000 family)
MGYGMHHLDPRHRPGFWHHPYDVWGVFGSYYGAAAGYSSYGSSPYDYSASSGAPTYAGGGGYDTSGASAYAQQGDSRAYITVIVPATAQVWCDGTPTANTGSVREYVTPLLSPGRQYTYWVRARWTENGHEVNQLQPVDVFAGGHFDVRFPAPTR